MHAVCVESFLMKEHQGLGILLIWGLIIKNLQTCRHIKHLINSTNFPSELHTSLYWSCNLQSVIILIVLMHNFVKLIY